MQTELASFMLIDQATCISILNTCVSIYGATETVRERHCFNKRNNLQSWKYTAVILSSSTTS